MRNYAVNIKEMLPICCQYLTEFVWNPHKYWLLFGCFLIRTRCSGSSTNCFCLGDMIPHESICVLVSCVHRVSELLLSNCYQRFVINAIWIYCFILLYERISTAIFKLITRSSHTTNKGYPFPYIWGYGASERAAKTLYKMDSTNKLMAGIEIIQYRYTAFWSINRFILQT